MTRRIRRGVIAATVAAVLVFVTAGVAHRRYALAFVTLEAGVVIVALALEKRRYRPTVDRSRGAWRATGESFVDPVSQRRVDVFYDAETGRRDYRS